MQLHEFPRYPLTFGPSPVRLTAYPLALLLLAGCSGTTDDTARTATGTTDDTARTATGTTDDTARTATGTTDDTAGTDVPALDVEVVADGLDIPWDVQLLEDGTALVGERGGRLLAVRDGEVVEVDAELPGLSAQGESGLMGLAVSPADPRTVFACYASREDGGDVRVARLQLDERVTRADLRGMLVTGLPLTSGRHSGCRLLMTPEDTVLVGTGDAADEANPQSLESLGGKVLELTLDGAPLPGGTRAGDGDPRILTYGHRNVQGLALRPGTNQVWEVEHGPDVDDEVNILEPGANYGWQPGAGYDEGAPMTDLDAFPDAVEAVWSSGAPTHATSGAVFLEGEQWGAWDGALAVAELKGSGVTVLTLDGDEVVDEARVPELDGEFGRLRSLTLDDEGALWVSTSNGDDDQLLRVTPQG